MNQNLIYYPCFALLVLSGLILLRMFATRVQAIRDGSTKPNYFKTYNEADKNLPRPMLQASRNFSNLFEVPTLFYMVCGFALMTKNVDEVMLYAAWVYVVLRFIHSLIHVTSNKLLPRMSCYGLSWLALMFMGVVLFFRVAQGN